MAGHQRSKREEDKGGQREDKGGEGGEGERERASRRARGSERVKRVRRRNGWKAKRGDQEGGRGISRADLPSCGEMADHHRRIIREPNIFSGLRY